MKILRNIQKFHKTTNAINNLLRKRSLPLHQSSATYAIKIISNDIPVERIRNIGISAHIDSGKTTLTERILYYTGRIEEMHEVRGKDGVGAVMDSMELERQRGITIQSAATYTMWKGCNINIIDTPGHVDFTVEVERALRVLDGAILVLCAVGGVQSQTMTVNRQMARYSVPCLAFINKLDRAGAQPFKVFEQLRKKLNHNAALVHLPIGTESNCKGIIDLIEEKAIYYEGVLGTEVRFDEIPKPYLAEVKDRRAELVEHASNADDELGEMYLEEKSPTIAELKAGIRRACIARKITPVFMGTALKNKGVQTLLDGVIEFLPNPTEIQNEAIKVVGDNVEETFLLNPERDSKKMFVALAFKLELAKFGQLTYLRVYQGKIKRGDSIFNARTNKKIRANRLCRMHSDKMEELETACAGDIIAISGCDCASGDTFTTVQRSNVSMETMFIPEPVVSMSIGPKTSMDAEKFAKAITRFTKEDPTFRVMWDNDAKQTLALGMGELHLEVYAQRIKREYGAEVLLGKPKVAFRQSLSRPCTFEYLHKKQSGGAGQYGGVKGVIEILPPSENTEIKFTDETTGTDIDKKFMSAILKGFKQACLKGHLSGHKVCGIHIRLQSGKSHIVDSSDYAFMLAAEGAMRDAFDTGDWQILEPYMNVELTVPNEFSKTVEGQMIKRQGTLLSIETGEEDTTMLFECSLNQMFGFAGDLRSMTQGKGEFSMEYSRYLAAPENLTQELIDNYQIEQERLAGKR